MANIFNLPSELPASAFLEPFVTENDTLIERIVSTRPTTPPGQWYDRILDNGTRTQGGYHATAIA